MKLIDPMLSFYLFSDTPCTCLGFWQNMLIGGFGNGKICIYNSENGRAMAEILAHGRWINSLDVSENGMVSHTPYWAGEEG